MGIVPPKDYDEIEEEKQVVEIAPVLIKLAIMIIPIVMPLIEKGAEKLIEWLKKKQDQGVRYYISPDQAQQIIDAVEEQL